MIEEAEEIARKNGINLKVSPRFEYSYKEGVEDIKYPIPVDEFRSIVENYKTQDIEKSSCNLKIEDIEYCDLCRNPWTTAMIYYSGNMMYCNRMNQPQASISFSSFFDLWNSINAQKKRNGLINKDLSWDCYNYARCDFGEAVKFQGRQLI